MRLEFNEYCQRFQLLPKGMNCQKNVGFALIDSAGYEPMIRGFIHAVESIYLIKPLRLMQVRALYILFRASFERDGPLVAVQSLANVLRLLA